jgi:hypothetical protein
MTFFARPNLDDVQFRQISGTTLTLTGTTNFVGTLKSKGVEIDGDNTGASYGDVMTYDGAGKIVLMPGGGGGSAYYSGASPSTCTVGGLVANSVLSGKTVSKILEEILVPTLAPTVTGPSNTFSIAPPTGIYEVGSTQTITGSINFSRGSISPQYCGTSPFRSGLPNTHKYQDFNGGFCCCTLTTLTSTYTMPARIITPGNNTAYGSVCYDAGPTTVKDSSGAVILPALSAGFTSPQPQTVTGLYPYFYGKVASGGAPAGSNRPAATCALVISGTKVVQDSTGTISINFGSSADDYIWFATPNASATKTKWYVDALNNGNIGGAVSPGGNLFPNNTPVTPVATVLWGGQTYKVYISNYQTASATIMELRNS